MLNTYAKNNDNTSILWNNVRIANSHHNQNYPKLGCIKHQNMDGFYDIALLTLEEIPVTSQSIPSQSNSSQQFSQVNQSHFS